MCAPGDVMAQIEDTSFLDAFKIRRVSDGKNLTNMFRNAITAADLEMTIEGAGTLTLTINDPDWVILTSGVFDRHARDRKLDKIDVKVDHRWYRLMAVQAQGSTLTLTCEEREVVYLRTHRKVKGKNKWRRSNHTRAEFVRHLVKQVKAGGGIEFYSPELHKRQPVARRFGGD
jgi:hypothetical protein